MVYTVGEMAKKLDVPASTLRYYDKEGRPAGQGWRIYPPRLFER